MVNKLKPDVVICGPAFNYTGAAYVAEKIESTTNSPAIAAMSVENESMIRQYKDKIIIVKTPKMAMLVSTNHLKIFVKLLSVKLRKKGRIISFHHFLNFSKSVYKMVYTIYNRNIKHKEDVG